MQGDHPLAERRQRVCGVGEEGERRHDDPVDALGGQLLDRAGGIVAEHPGGSGADGDRGGVPTGVGRGLTHDVDQLGDATCLALLQKGYDLKAHNFHRMFVLKNMRRVSEAGAEPQVWEYVGTPDQLATESAAFRPEKRERAARSPREHKAPTVDSIVGNVGKLDEAGKAALAEKLRAAGLI